MTNKEYSRVKDTKSVPSLSHITTFPTMYYNHSPYKFVSLLILALFGVGGIIISIYMLTKPPTSNVTHSTTGNMIVHLQKNLDPVPLQNNDTLQLRSLIGNFIKETEKKFPKDRQHVGDMIPTHGTDEIVHSNMQFDSGFFNTIIKCYNNHWALRTIPDDWWNTIVKIVSLAIDDHSKDENVRKFFVNHEGKKTLSVEVSSMCEINFDHFFKTMTNLIQANINIDGYVDTVRADFSTSTPTHRIVSEIMVMTSMQEFFEYEMFTLCGIPFIEFIGAEKDWKHLKTKLLALKDMLQPIEVAIGLKNWWDDIEIIFDKLVQSVQGNPDIEWWTNILVVTPSDTFGSGDSRPLYDGWFITKILNKPDGVRTLSALPSGLASVPLKINDNGNEFNASLVSGIAGMKIDHSKNAPIVEATHGWAMLTSKENFLTNFAQC